MPHKEPEVNLSEVDIHDLWKEVRKRCDLFVLYAERNGKFLFVPPLKDPAHVIGVIHSRILPYLYRMDKSGVNDQDFFDYCNEEEEEIEEIESQQETT